MSWRGTLQGSAPTEQSEVSEQSPPECQIVQNVQIVHGVVNRESPPGPATEQDFRFGFFEAVDRLNTVLPHGIKTGDLSNHSDIKRFGDTVDAVWIEARSGGRHGELFGKFREALFAWEAALLDGHNKPDICRKFSGGLIYGEIQKR